MKSGQNGLVEDRPLLAGSSSAVLSSGGICIGLGAGEKKVTLRVFRLEVASSAVLLLGILNIFGESTAERQRP
jgi:hypothetical protein